MKAILTLAALLMIVTTAVGSAFLYLNDSYVSSGALFIICFSSLSLWIKSTGGNVVDSEKHTQ
jgi:hypothetical protein